MSKLLNSFDIIQKLRFLEILTSKNAVFICNKNRLANTLSDICQPIIYSVIYYFTSRIAPVLPDVTIEAYLAR